MDSLKEKFNSVRGDGIRNQVTSKFSRGEKAPAHSGYAPRPINELRDPSTFEPPPKRNPSALSRPPPVLDRIVQALDDLPHCPGVFLRKTSSRPPPRLPPRSQPTSPTQADPHLNQSAVSRLGAAGVSVPGFGISPTSSSNPPPPPAQGTTWAQKQAALRTARDFHKDPSSVSLQDARSAASTANNFRQRHGEQVTTGVRTANNFNQKYGIANRVQGFATGQAAQPATETAPPAVPAAKKKPPPPPPPKKRFGANSPAAADTPPPLPLGTKPRST
ncbi:hypothetical protein jhhlp_001921 [Lomentospora prolificans]|uniref:Uncharacterized protein n=1 Tax=Lomentospora prolificans TaxID=41688 RepID=A0A2N3NCL9_9PEZI|nr:hypothetical protein jhhlp_001921 [Lomentospora prolificans]